MKPRRNILFIVIGVILVILFLGAGVLLYFEITQYYAARKLLEGEIAKQQALYSRNPFPSQQNIGREQKKIGDLKAASIRLYERLREGQVEPVEQSPARFSSQFFALRKVFLSEAKDREVKVLDTFTFGFARHMEGVPPMNRDVPRLTQQLLIVSNLLHVLYSARITELKGVIREEFEEGGGGASSGESGAAAPAPGGGGRLFGGGGAPGRPGASADENLFSKESGMIPEGALFGKYHFEFRFDATEAVLREVLDTLVTDPMVIVVTRLDVAAGENWEEKKLGTEEQAGGVPPALGDGAGLPVAAATNEPSGPAPRDERIVCGQASGILAVAMELDVYLFRSADISTLW